MKKKGDRRSRYASEASKLAPPEEQARAGMQQGSNHIGASSAAESLKLAKDLIDDDEDTSGLFRPDPAVIVILCLALAFIAFIAYLISIEPPAPK